MLLQSQTVERGPHAQDLQASDHDENKLREGKEGS